MGRENIFRRLGSVWLLLFKKITKSSWKGVVNYNDKHGWNGNYWLKEKTFRRRETAQGMGIYNLEGPILNKHLLNGIFPKENRWKENTLSRDLTESNQQAHHTSSQAKTFKVGGDLSVGALGAFSSRITLLWGTHIQKIDLAMRRNGINAKMILNSYRCQLMFSVKRNYGLDLGSYTEIFFINCTHCL